MKTKSWIEKLNPFTKDAESLEIKALQERLDALADERDTGLEIKSFDMTGSAEEGTGVESHVDISTLQRIYTSETWVYNAITAIAETIASLPIKLEKSKKVTKNVKNELTGETENIEQKVWIDASGEKLFDSFQYPNRYTTKSEFYMLLVIDLLSAGEYFIYLDAAEGVDLTTVDTFADNNPDSPFGRLRTLLAADNTPIKGMYRLPPNILKPVLSADKKCIEGYSQLTEDGEFAYSAAEIIHVKLPNPLNQLRGLSPLVAVFKQVLIDKFSTEHMIRFYQSGARLGGVISTTKDMNKEQMGRFQRSFENNFTGKQNHHRTLILPPGMSYSPIEQNPAESSLLEFSKYNREAILSAFRVPPIKVGILDNANYANAKAQLTTFFNDCIKPKLTFMEDGFNLKACLMPDNRSYRFKFDLGDVQELKEDLEIKAKTGEAMLKAGLTVDEVRRDLWKKDPIPGGDKSPAIEAMPKPAAPAWGLSAPKPDEAKLDVPTASLEAPSKESTGCEKCKKDPCECPPTKQSLAEFITESLAKLDPSESVDAALLSDLVAIFNTRDGVPSDTAKDVMPEAITGEAQIEDAAQATTQDEIASETPKDAPGSGFSKAQRVEHWKGFIDRTEPITEKRVGEVQKFFKKFESAVLNRFGGNIKSHGVLKARDSDDADEIMKLSAYEDIIRQYTKEVDEALLEAYSYGLNATLGEFKFNPPDEDAIAYLEKFAAKSVTYISETTRDQMREVLVDAFEQGLSVGEVSGKIREKFTEISQGRAITIARTETLTAVSMGKHEKQKAFKEEFPEKKLKKQWISSQDERVRDSHAELDGTSVSDDEPFDNGLMFPRDVSVEDPSEIINCRCDYTVYAAEDQDVIDATLPDQEADSSNDENSSA